MARIPTPIPKHWIKRVEELLAGSVPLTLYRLGLIALGGTIIYLMAISSTFLVSFLGATALGIWLADDVGATMRNLWNANFWEVKL